MPKNSEVEAVVVASEAAARPAFWPAAAVSLWQSQSGLHSEDCVLRSMSGLSA